MEEELKKIHTLVKMFEGALGIENNTQDYNSTRLQTILHRVQEAKYLFKQGLKDLGG
jgi:hypothetical protein